MITFARKYRGAIADAFLGAANGALGFAFDNSVFFFASGFCIGSVFASILAAELSELRDYLGGHE